MVNDKCDPPSKTVGTTEGNVKLEASERKAGAGSRQPPCSNRALRIIMNKALFFQITF